MSGPSWREKHPTLVREAGKGLGVVGLLVVLMMWLAGAFIDKVEPGPTRQKPRPENLNVYKVQHRTYPLIVDQTGTVRSKTEAQVSCRIMAQVKEIVTREGDKVCGGEDCAASPTVMARLDDRDVQAKLRQAKSQVSVVERAVAAARAKLAAVKAQAESARANRDKALSDFRRYEELQGSPAVSKQQLDQYRAQKDVAEAQLTAALQEIQAAEVEIERLQVQKEQAEAAVAETSALLSYTVIQAPFTGHVVRKMVDVGDMASPGQPLFLIETSSLPELHVNVSESILPHLKDGQEMEVLIDALGRSFPGSICEIMPQSDPSTRTVLVKVSLPSEPGLVNGLFGRLRVPCGRYDTLVVPAGAVREVGQLQLVDVLDSGGIPDRRFVTLGRTHEGLVEVLSGLKEGEEVVIP